MYKKLAINFSSLSILQVSNYIFPLITFPYLVRVLGVENYGLANFILAFTAYFVTITDYGFNLSATREVSLFKKNKKQLAVIFNSTLLIKIILSIFTLILFIPLMLIVTKFRSNAVLYFIAYINVFGNVLFPVWFFQGMEKMVPITAVTIFYRVLGVIAIFVLVNKPADVYYYILINGATYFLMGVSAIIVILSLFKMRLYIPNKFSFLLRLKKGWYIFLANISINLYTTSNTFILGLISGNTAVGYFSTANKLREAAQGVVGNMGRTVYPHVGNILKKSKKEGLLFVKKYLSLVGFVSFIISCGIFLFANEIIKIAAGTEYLCSVTVLRILAFTPFVITLSNVFGIQLMINLGYEKQFKKIITNGAIINLLLMLILVPLFDSDGAAFSVLLVESFITISMFNHCRKERLI